jgi:hypothetical protein
MIGQFPKNFRGFFYIYGMSKESSRGDLMELSLEDAEFILGMDVKEYTSLRPGKCEVCAGERPFSIEPAKAILDGNDDLIVEGKCDGCANPLDWRMETSKKNDMKNRAQHVRSIRGLFST